MPNVEETGEERAKKANKVIAIERRHKELLDVLGRKLDRVIFLLELLTGQNRY